MSSMRAVADVFIVIFIVAVGILLYFLLTNNVGAFSDYSLPLSIVAVFSVAIAFVLAFHIGRADWKGRMSTREVSLIDF